MNHTQPLGAANPRLSSSFNSNQQTIVLTIAVGVLSLFLFVYAKLKQYRSQFQDIPHLPRSFWLGNAKQLDAYSNPRHHPGLDILPTHVSYLNIITRSCI